MNVLVDARDDSLRRITGEMARMMEEMVSRRFVPFRTEDAWQPAMNLYETTTEYVVCIDLSGVDHKAIDVKAHEGVLHVTGRREIPRPQTDQEVCVHLMEIEHGAFYRQIELPDEVVLDGTEATYRHGFLWIRVPKA